ncbi:MAG: hypothetical protein JSS46_10715 [Proteobacteria bacterium]|jgi:hypothetical protein|nr:hypothetical protein [Pseudomonadota bacterium]
MMDGISMSSPSPVGWRYRTALAASVACLVLVIVDFGLAQANHALQDEVNQRQQAINQGLTLSRVNEALIRDLAVASIRDKDTKLGALLAAQGISVNLTPAAAPGTGAGDSGAKGSEAKGSEAKEPGTKDSSARGTAEAASKRTHERP